MKRLKTYAAQSRGPTTYQLKNTLAWIKAGLDHESDIGLKWSLLWLASHGALKTPPSGVMRRAIALYVRHLEALEGPDTQGEVRRVHEACKRLATANEDREAALQRLSAISPTVPLPVLGEVLHGPRYHAMRAELLALGSRYV